MGEREGRENKMKTAAISIIIHGRCPRCCLKGDNTGDMTERKY